MQTLVAFFFVLGVLIFVHELGHYMMAKRLGVRVLTFSLGFGPKLLKFRRGDTEYCISAIPLGGYVKMAGENPDDPRSGRPDEFAVRFHLHPAIRANRLTDGHGVMLMLPNREVWTFSAHEDFVELEESVHLAGRDGPRRTTQIVIYGHARQMPRVHWSFAHVDPTAPVRRGIGEEPELPL